MVRDIFLGKELIESRIEYKYALLRAQLGLFLGAICFTYIFIDSLNGVFVYIAWYLGGMVASFLVIYLNRKRKYLFSSVLLLLTANMLVFLIASLEDSQGGAFFYFVATSTIGLVVFDPIEKRLGILFIGLSLALAAIAYFGEGLPIEAPKEDKNYEMISFTVNFILGLLSSVLVLLFVMNRNQESESSLIDKQEELKELAKELEKSKNQYALAVDGTEAGIYEWDALTNRVFASLKYKSLLGYNSDDELHTDLNTFRSAIPLDNQISKSTSDVNNTKQIRYQKEVQLELKDGRYRWFLDSGIISMKENVANLAVGSIIDIHDRKIAEQQLRDKNLELEKTNEELDSFVYRASHDMRAPLTTLLGLLNLAKLTKDENELDTYHDLMINRINTMDGFIREVTDYARNARLEIVEDTVNVFQLVKEVKEQFDFLASQSQIEFKIEIDPDLEIQIDRARLKVILHNIIYNAIKYHDTSKSKRFLKVRASLDKGCIFMQFIDNGIGISQEYQQNIFDMFFRATQRSDGSGLGLYIVKETVHRIKGSITCQSIERLGSTFEVRIPADLDNECESETDPEIPSTNI